MHGRSRGFPYGKHEDRMENEEGPYTCPRCGSHRTAECDEAPLAGYQRCIICGNCWNISGSRNDLAPKETPETPSDAT